MNSYSVFNIIYKRQAPCLCCPLSSEHSVTWCVCYLTSYWCWRRHGYSLFSCEHCLLNGFQHWVICHLSDNKLYLQVGSPTLPSIGFAVSSSGLFSYILVRSFMSACLTLVGVGQPKRHLTWPIPSCTKCEFHRNFFRLKAHFVYKMQRFLSAPCCIFLSM